MGEFCLAGAEQLFRSVSAWPEQATGRSFCNLLSGKAVARARKIATFFAALAPGHAIQAMAAQALQVALQADPNVAGVIPALASARREWAAAAEYLGKTSLKAWLHYLPQWLEY